jgi:nucleoside-diphosphate-sugar epimerase
LGGTGVLGKYLINELKNSGYKNIYIFLRKSKKNQLIKSQNQEIHFFHGNFFDISDLSEFIQANSVIINLIYFGDSENANLKFTTNLANIIKQKNIKKLIHISSTDVIGRSSNSIINEESACFPYSKYAKNKLKIENIFLRHLKKNQFVILRCNSVIGGGAIGFNKLLRQVTLGNKFQNFIFSCLHNKRPLHFIHIFNVISAIIFFVENKNNKNLYYLSQDDEYVANYLDLQYEIAKYKNVVLYNKNLVIDMRFILSILLKIMGKNNLATDRLIMGNSIKYEGFNYPIKFLDSLADILEYS